MGELSAAMDLAAESLLDTINDPDKAEGRDRVLKLFVLGQDGRPTHPMARGRHRIPDDAVPVPIARCPGSIVALGKDAA